MTYEVYRKPFECFVHWFPNIFESLKGNGNFLVFAIINYI